MTPSQQRQRQQQQQQQRQQPLSLSLSSFSFFERINDVDTLSPDDFLDRFEKYGFFWFKGTSSSSSTKGETILNFIKEHAVACEKSWTVENHGNGSSSSSSSRGRDSSGNSSSSNGNKKKMKQITTLSSPPPRIVTPQTLCNFTGTNESFYMIGRAEHVDEVTHSGTYHIQIAGTKTWWIRPHPDCSFLNEELSSLVSSSSSSSLDNTNHNNNSNCFSRMKINVEEGDVFVLNTKIWYHNTELEYTPTKLSPSNNNNNNNESNSNSSSGGEWSISIAQDFYLPVPCPKDVSKGDMGECNNDDDNDSDNDGEKIALIALRNIIEGESLSIAFDDQDGGDDQLGNANEQIDPRIISEQYWTTNQIVLRGENRIPNDLPRSYEPNCELIEIDDTDGGDGNVCLALRALMDIPIGGVFCISPDDDEEYEEVEVDLGTGELVT
ncbi:hypothetical protein FRACYDRAFT_251159 [Fragilariopsis cylindrus CCMP1102]|uniref:Uncharacterized protein n=1 Tax=Fragilariopsis cylindrus CCMP1102 TaxID=635003 RepID=A0A1E7EP85_9STRA|nr:hypothetical protein FRACYDRAFT_251159 [Fragilariopsis cylindrus CCMP1102]|eukprot:OEU07353.1 hypothetical protein FRACYDRAFT_251159 [Fragilariopsis cylindrus CCMP1102]